MPEVQPYNNSIKINHLKLHPNSVWKAMYQDYVPTGRWRGRNTEGRKNYKTTSWLYHMYRPIKSQWNCSYDNLILVYRLGRVSVRSYLNFCSSLLSISTSCWLCFEKEIHLRSSFFWRLISSVLQFYYSLAL